MTKVQLGQVLSCWSNVSPDGAAEYVRSTPYGTPVTGYGVLLRYTYSTVFDQDMTNCHGQIFSKSGRSIDYPLTKIRLSILGQGFECMF